jgi:hypothetical protein
MTYSKDVVDTTYSKNRPSDDAQPADLVRYVVAAWGVLQIPTLRAAPPSALVSLATRSVVSLANLEALSVDDSAELQGRIETLTHLAGPPTSPPLLLGSPGSTLPDMLSWTLPDRSLTTSWDVLLTAVVAAAAVLGATVAHEQGAQAGASAALDAWADWLVES